jgi:hypothetical protein
VLEELYATQRAAGTMTLDALSTLGGVHELRARLAWLGDVRRELLS